MWYDPSEIVQRPDKSDDAVLLYDRMELNGSALRRETGFSEADAPTESELDEMTEKLEVFAPVYVVFTKADLISGFAEFFEDRDRDEPLRRVRQARW